MSEYTVDFFGVTKWKRTTFWYFQIQSFEKNTQELVKDDFSRNKLVNRNQL